MKLTRIGLAVVTGATNRRFVVSICVFENVHAPKR